MRGAEPSSGAGGPGVPWPCAPLGPGADNKTFRHCFKIKSLPVEVCTENKSFLV